MSELKPCPLQEKLTKQGVFKGAHGVEGLEAADNFWEKQLYGTRLYYGDGLTDYLHRDVLRAAIRALKEPTPDFEARAVEAERKLNSCLTFTDGERAMIKHCLCGVELIESGNWSVAKFKRWLNACMHNDPKFLEEVKLEVLRKEGDGKCTSRKITAESSSNASEVTKEAIHFLITHALAERDKGKETVAHELECVSELIEQLQSQLTAAQKEVERLKDCLEPGKASAILNGFEDFVKECGYCGLSSRPSLLFLRDYVEGLKQQLTQAHAAIVKKDEALRFIRSSMQGDPHYEKDTIKATEALSTPESAKELVRDRERLDWLQKNHRELFDDSLFHFNTKQLRQAIDAAMSKTT